jgi:cytochrome c oxidase subunit 3
MSAPTGHEARPETSAKRNGEAHEIERRRDEQSARMLMWLFVSALSMGFAALSVVWIYKISDRLSYYFVAPKTLWLSTAILLASSYCYHMALRAVRGENQRALVLWLRLTFLLGAAFLVSQTSVWMAISKAGMFSPSNPFSVLFYIITGVHAAHLLGGMIWTGYVLFAAQRGVFSSRRHLGVELGAVYWHFIDVAWVILFVLLSFL